MSNLNEAINHVYDESTALAGQELICVDVAVSEDESCLVAILEYSQGKTVCVSVDDMPLEQIETLEYQLGFAACLGAEMAVYGV
jgi:hypothetical protein